MTVTHYGNQQYRGLSSDTKPTNAAVNAQYYETDTGKLYRYNGTAWSPEYIKNPASTIVFKDGTTYYAQEADGTIVSSSTTDASIPINAAINNIPGAAARAYGGRVFIFAGDYQCKTGIAADISTTAYQGVELVGEGIATQLNFTPTSALTNGLLLRVNKPRVANMRLYGNSNVTNIIKAIGPDLGGRHDHGILENLQIDSATAPDATAAPSAYQAGQKGVFMDGSVTALFFWDFVNLKMRGLDIGAHIHNQYATSTNQVNITGYRNNITEKISGSQHNIHNCWFQGTSGIGTYGILFTSEGTGIGSISNVSNVVAELFKTGAESAAICIEKGSTNITTSAISNPAIVDPTLHYRILDKNVKAVNNHSSGDEKSLYNTRGGHGWWEFGLEPFGSEGGIFRRSIIENPASTFTTGPSVNGAAKVMATPSSVNTVRSIYYNKHDGYTTNLNTSNWTRQNNPRLLVRFLPVSTTQLRLFIGIWNQFAAPTSTADILNARAGFGLWVDTGVSPNYQVMHNDNAGASTVTQLGAGIPYAASYSTVEIITAHSDGKFGLNFNSDASPWTTFSASTNIPDNTYPLGWLISIENIAVATRTVWLYHIDQQLTM